MTDAISVPDGDALDRPAGPVTIVAARYGGIYEPGRWLAFPLWPEELPDGWSGGDAECYAFWQEHRDYGGGDTPTAAYRDLLRRSGGVSD
jgi:hypothetical protein